MRQLTDDDGVVTLAESFTPYGETLSLYGEDGSSFGYAGEMTDESGLQYLRARYMNPALGRFISRDTWGGDYNQPHSFNRWNYVYGNPVMYTDPSGMCSPRDPDYDGCIASVKLLEEAYAFTIYWPGRDDVISTPVYPPEYSTGDCWDYYTSSVYNSKFEYWDKDDLHYLAMGLSYISNVIGYQKTKLLTSGGTLFRFTEVQGLTGNGARGFYCKNGICSGSDISKEKFSFTGTSYGIGFGDSWSESRQTLLEVAPNAFSVDKWSKIFTVIHEFGHRLNTVVGSDVDNTMYLRFVDQNSLSQKYPSNYSETSKSEQEYFAETFAYYVWAHNGYLKYKKGVYTNQIFSDYARPKITSLEEYFEKNVLGLLP